MSPRPGDALLLGVVSAATALLLLDVTIINVALPVIAADLDATFDEVQWVIDAYAVALAALLLMTGAVADRVGRRRIFLVGLSIFIAASVWCASAPTATSLDIARGAQGLGAAAIFSTSLALLASRFEGPRRGFAFGVWGAVSGGAMALGPVVGGAIVEGFDWRWIFWVNLPLGAALLVAASRLEESRDPQPRRLDPLGAITLTGSLTALIVWLIRGDAAGWGSTEGLTPMIAGLALLGAFIAIELRVREPMLELRWFRNRAFAGTAAVSFGQSVAIYPMFLFIAIWLQDILRMSPLDAGLRLLPMTLVLFAFAPVGGRLTGRVPLGTLLTAGLGGLGIALLLMRAVEPGSEWTALLPGLIVGGASIGFISPALAAAMVAVLPVERSGLSSGINNTFRQIGIAAGLAGLGTVFESAVTSGATPAEGVVAGLDRVFAIGAGVAFATAVVAWLTLRGETTLVSSPDSSGG